MSTTTTAAKAAKHATPAQMKAISDAHGLTDEVIRARVVAVADALASGTDVKTLAADMAAAAKLPRSEVVAVGQNVLGAAKAAASILTGVGLTLDTSETPDPAQVRMLAQSYRAVQRHGVTVAVRDLKAVGIKAKTPAAKLANVTKAATAAVADAVETRATKAKGTRTKAAPAAGTHTAASVVKGIADRIRTGALPMSEDLRAAVALLAEVTAAAKTPAATPTPATVPAAKAAAKAA